MSGLYLLLRLFCIDDQVECGVVTADGFHVLRVENTN